MIRALPTVTALLGVTACTASTHSDHGRHPDAHRRGERATAGPGAAVPGPSQPVIAVDVLAYASRVAAHNAMVLRARAGRSASHVTLTTGDVAVVYQTEFDPADHGQDWACAVAHGTALTVVTTAVRDTSFNARSLAGDVLGSAR